MAEAGTRLVGVACLHCGSSIPSEASSREFCCAGCEAVFGLLRDYGLGRYYDLARGKGVPVAAPARIRNFAWLEPMLAQRIESAGELCDVDLDVQGVHCAACVWLMNELFRRRSGGVCVTVNPALGKVRLVWRRGAFDVQEYLSEVERFGYLFGPSRKREDASSRDLRVRLGVCVAATMNVMLFSVSFYVGLTPTEGDTFRLFTRLSLLLSTLVVIVGGWPFFRSAWQGLRRGVLHLDLPIALGILLTYGASIVQARAGRGDHAYLDTLDTFVTLMLVGRWLQQRVLEGNRRFLLEDEGVDGLLVRRRVGSVLELVAAARTREGDVMVLAPGDLVPVDAELLDAVGSFSTDWINGEAKVKSIERGAIVRAGSFQAGRAAVSARAKTSFDESPLVELLRAAPSTEGRISDGARFFALVARRYVLVVLTLALVGLLAWWRTSPMRAIDTTVALLVVTCPCALGIAVPLAYEIALARLRRAGIFVRRVDLLDRLPRVKRVLFDKTGTLTLGRLELVDPSSVSGLRDELRDALYDMVARSNHPVSRCLASALVVRGACVSDDADVQEVPGNGLEMRRDGRVLRLGRASWAGHEESDATVLSIDSEIVATFAMRDAIRSDARAEIGALHDRGIEVYLSSGDDDERVQTMARALSIPKHRALGGQSPSEKASLVERIDREDTLFLGDGVNDSLAFERAYCAGTPCIDRPVMPAKSDFFLLGEGIAPIGVALDVARDLRAVVRRILLLALAYNVVTVTAALAGAMTPLAAALAMPLSSLTVILFATHALKSSASRVPLAAKEVTS